MLVELSRPESARRIVALPPVIVALALFGVACDSTPGAPTTGLSAPTLSAPGDDAIAPMPPVLTVNNSSSVGTGPRTYDFAVADSQASLSGPGTALVATASGISEGGGGHTSYGVSASLQTGRRYFWRARAVQAGTAGPWSAIFRFRTDYAPNAAPAIRALNPSSDRAEVNAEVSLNAVVEDPEPTPGALTYDWSADGGTFSGNGASVRWRAPGVSSPTAMTLTLTVTERYTVTDPDGRPENRENVVRASTVVHVNDSRAEITGLSMTFLDDFVHSERTPEHCVRNFTDGCQGKQWEYDDIKRNREAYVNDPARSSFSVNTITFNGGMTRATVLAPCRFGATEKATGAFGIANGTCRLIHVYENRRWYLCESWFDPPMGAQFDGFSRKFIF
jgi:hypothetical protein